MQIAIGKSVTDIHWQNREVSWERFCKMLEKPIRTPETVSEYQNMTRTQKSRIKDIGGFVGGSLIKEGHRKSDNIRERCMLTFDLDRCNDHTLERIRDHAVSWAIYTTHSHTEENPRFRLLIPLDQPIAGDKYQAVARKTAADWKLLHTVDKASFRPAQIMFWPSVPRDGEYYTEYHDGPYLKVDDVLNEYENWKDPTSWPTSSDERHVPKNGKKIHRKDPRGDSGASQKFCSRFTVQEAIDQFLTDVYEPTEHPDRYTYIGAESVGGLVIYDDGLWAYSFHESDPAGDGHLHNAFDLVQLHKFGTDAKAFHEMANFTARLFYREREMEQHGAGDPQTEEPWKDELKYNEKTLKLSKDRSNISLILHNDKAFENIRFNQMSQQIECDGPCPWNSSILNRSWTDGDYAQAMEYTELKYGVDFVRQDFHDKILVLAKERSYNPIMEYLESLPKWDGIERAEMIFIDYLGAADNVYTREATFKWLYAAVKRIYEPGCKFDYVPILGGDQGIGKSTIGAKLAGKWFSDSLNFMDMTDTKKGAEKLADVWIEELPELKGMNRVEVNASKSFITSRSDKFRKAYGHVTTDHPRMCVLFGTTNDDNYLRDLTGGRRYWPIPVSGKNVVKHPYYISQEEVEQIWAEVLEKYKENPDLDLSLSRESDEIANRMRIEVLESDDREGFLEAFLEIPLPTGWEKLTIPDQQKYIANYSEDEAKSGRRRKTVTISEIWQVCFGQPEYTRTKSQSNTIAAMLKRLHWEADSKRVRVPNYGRQKIYHRIEEESE